MKKQIAEILGSWLPIAAVITVFVAYTYVSQQQNMRLSANDLPLQIAQDSAESLAKGADPESAAPQTKTDLSKSISAFILILDDSQKELVSSMELDGQTPIPPKDVLDYAKEHGENRVTWQPKKGVRVAIVVKYYKDTVSGYVIGGQSLREVEYRTDMLTLQSVIAYATAMILSLGLTAAYKLAKDKSSKTNVTIAESAANLDKTAIEEAKLPKSGKKKKTLTNKAK